MCERRVLAEAPVGRLELCDCGTVHLAVGAVTLRLPTAAIPALRELLDDALQTDPHDAPLATSHAARDAAEGATSRKRTSLH
jgi:hypothetical protein